MLQRVVERRRAVVPSRADRARYTFGRLLVTT